MQHLLSKHNVDVYNPAKDISDWIGDHIKIHCIWNPYLSSPDIVVSGERLTVISLTNDWIPFITLLMKHSYIIYVVS